MKQPAQAELARRELARRHLLDFTKYNFPTYDISWHHRKIADALERIEQGTLRRLMVFMPPRHGKSELISIQYPAWLLGRNPDLQVIEASYSADLAQDFGRQTRNLVMGPSYRNLFNTSLSDDSASRGSWHTKGARGAYNAVGVGGSATGKGADRLIIDDPIKNRQDADSDVIREGVWGWYTSTARTRLMPGGAIILVMTRWHDDDLAGRILKSEGAAEWEVLQLPAIATQDEDNRRLGEPLWPTRYSLQELNAIKSDVGIFDWNALYQGNPLDDATREFKREYMKEVDRPFLQTMDTNCVIAIDTAVSQKASADYTGISIVNIDKANNWYVSAKRMRITPLELIDNLFSLYALHRPTRIGIEKTIYLQAVKPFLDAEMRRRNQFLPIYELQHHQTNKETRIRGLLPRYQSGSIYHIRGECDDLVEELLRFPKGVHDDVLDSFAYINQIATNAVGGVVHNGTPIYGQQQVYNAKVYGVPDFRDVV
jgi:hypothetical protein